MIIPSHIVAQAETAGLALCSIRPSQVYEGDAMAIDGKCMRVRRVEFDRRKNEIVIDLWLLADDGFHIGNPMQYRARDDERITVWRFSE